MLCPGQLLDNRLLHHPSLGDQHRHKNHPSAAIKLANVLPSSGKAQLGFGGRSEARPRADLLFYPPSFPHGFKPGESIAGLKLGIKTGNVGLPSQKLGIWERVQAGDI